MKKKKKKDGICYQVERRIYCFQESLPASRPPPVAFSPPKAPPISAPFVGILTFTMPQSLPRGLHQVICISELARSQQYLNGGKTTTPHTHTR